jgi:hypothetical protein
MEEYIEVKATVRISNQKIQDLIVAAVEGGSNYWAKFVFPQNYKQKCQNYYEIPFNNDNIEVYDSETDELLGYLNRMSIKVGLQLMADRKDMKGRVVPSMHFKNIATDNEDAVTADVFLQFCVMGEIVYG